MLVAGRPPLALLLDVELIVHAPKASAPATSTTQTNPNPQLAQTPEATQPPAAPPTPDVEHRPPRTTKPTAESIMWAHYETELKSGRTPTGAELDRIAGTTNYGRAVLARWRNTGRIPATE